MSPDDRVIDRLLETGAVTHDQVAEARAALAELERGGRAGRPLAELLVERGHVDAETLAHVRAEENDAGGKKTIAGFEILEMVGSGSTGAVYKAKQLSLGRVVALKVLDPKLAKDPRYVQGFLEEARSVARLSHTNIVSGIDVGEEDGIPYVAMEYADGVTLSRVLRRGGAMDEERAVLVALQLARALEYIHKNGVVHGRVRPDNVIITGDGVTKLGHLGQGGRHQPAAAQGDPGDSSGDYSSPEQLRGYDALTAAADLYALGCVLYHMLTGEVPFPAVTRQEAVMRHLTEPAPSIGDTDPELTDEIDVIVSRLLEKEPGARFGSATDACLAMEEAWKRLKARRAGTESPAPPKGSPSGAPRTRRRRRRR